MYRKKLAVAVAAVFTAVASLMATAPLASASQDYQEYYGTYNSSSEARDECEFLMRYMDLACYYVKDPAEAPRVQLWVEWVY